MRAPLVVPGGTKVTVASFKITGNTVYSEDLLQALLGGYIGKQLDLADLDQAAAQISQYYRRHGYFVARAYLPA
ncbi:MAG: POTRA domain-containing protein, partial [Rhodoferax sp.]|nr:POTRA domain-containing protein [Rhodoferax sp.]